jgi:hypothetical protein
MIVFILFVDMQMEGTKHALVLHYIATTTGSALRTLSLFQPQWLERCMDH